MGDVMPQQVRDPAWSLSRSAIGLWVTEGVIGTLVYGALVAVFLLFVPDGGPVPVLRWLLPTLLAVSRSRRSVSGRGCASACTTGRSPARRSTPSPAG